MAPATTRRVSWLIPVRNGARWLGDALGSVLAECSHEDEVIVVDDGSDDNPVRPDDARVRWFTTPPRGITPALELGRAHCRGTFIARMDADDRALPGRITHQLGMLEQDPQLGAVGGRAILHNDTGTDNAGMQLYIDWINGLSDLHREILVESPLIHPATTIRAEALAAVGGYREGDLPEDYDLWLRLVAAGWKIAAVNQEVVWMRDRPDRLTRTDPRYGREAFLKVKQEFLATTLLRTPQRVLLWGASKGGRPWLRWLLAQGHEVVLALDLVHGTTRHGVQVRHPSVLGLPPGHPDAVPPFDRMLVAVGSRGARAEIRAWIPRLRPELVEGEHWWAVT